MPQMANITVKKADGATDQVLVAMRPSAGDGSPASWRLEAGSLAPMAMPTFSVTTRSNGAKNARRVNVEVVVPYVVMNTTTGTLQEVARMVFTGRGAVIPAIVPITVANEAIALYQGFIASWLVRDTFRTGFAPT